MANIIETAEFWFLIKVDFFLPQVAQFDESINLFFFGFCNTWIFVYNILFTTDTIRFDCHLKSGNIFMTINFIAFDCIILSNLSSNLINLVKILLFRDF